MKNWITMQFDPFVIPFNIGLYFIIVYCVVRCIIWFRDLSRTDKLRLQRGFFGKPFIASLKEIFMESLLHRKIFRVNRVLGYMHMSLAFGWFLLILFGTIEADIFGTRHLNPPYKAIFFRFFNPEEGATGFARGYTFMMDLILAFILSGLLIAIIKRFWSRIVGMRKTTKLKTLDKIALTSLWLIFPSRLLAESFTSAIYDSGSFLTAGFGSFLAGFLPAESLAYPFWWLYSLSLGTFFILLPRTRYMHIPTEIFLIFLRNSGVTTGDQYGSYAEAEVYSCSSCGICINVCQMNSSAGINNIQSAYFVKGLKREDDVYDISLNCLMCGRCEVSCPVGIELGPLRMIQRRAGEAPEDLMGIWTGFMRERNQEYLAGRGEPRVARPYSYLAPPVKKESCDVLYFAGCMSHLTPGITRAVESIFNEAGIDYSFMDRDGSICCGRPLTLAGRDREARELIRRNSEEILQSGATTLVTSCPICYRIFRESYHLDLEVLHHSQYINRLIEERQIRLNFLNQSVVYHDPCELGRGSGIYDDPREVLVHVARLEDSRQERENAPCCGGSLANLKLDRSKVHAISRDAFNELTLSKPDYLATSCPLCKKSFSRNMDANSTLVLDIAEIVALALVRSNAGEPAKERIHIQLQETVLS